MEEDDEKAKAVIESKKTKAPELKSTVESKTTEPDDGTTQKPVVSQNGKRIFFYI